MLYNSPLPPEGTQTHIYSTNSCYLTPLFRFCWGQHSPSGMSIAVTTTPMVLVTASPTFLAKVPLSSSSSSASSRSAWGKNLCWGHNSPNINSFTTHRWWKTGRHLTLLRECVPSYEALCSKQTSQTLTGARPQPLSGTGAALEEQPSQKPSPQARQWCLLSLSWKTAWHLWHTLYESKNKNKSCCCREEETNRVYPSSILWPATLDCVISAEPRTVNIPLDTEVLTWLLEVGGAECHSPRWGSWVSSRPGRSDPSAKRWRP